jgi:hypothetical protein
MGQPIQGCAGEPFAALHRLCHRNSGYLTPLGTGYLSLLW